MVAYLQLLLIDFSTNLPGLDVSPSIKRCFDLFFFFYKKLTMIQTTLIIKWKSLTTGVNN